MYEHMINGDYDVLLSGAMRYHNLHAFRYVLDTVPQLIQHESCLCHNLAMENLMLNAIELGYLDGVKCIMARRSYCNKSTEGNITMKTHLHKEAATLLEELQSEEEMFKEEAKCLEWAKPKTQFLEHAAMFLERAVQGHQTDIIAFLFDFYYEKFPKININFYALIHKAVMNNDVDALRIICESYRKHKSFKIRGHTYIVLHVLQYGFNLAHDIGREDIVMYYLKEQWKMMK